MLRVWFRPLKELFGDLVSYEDKSTKRDSAVQENKSKDEEDHVGRFVRFTRVQTGSQGEFSNSQLELDAVKRALVHKEKGESFYIGGMYNKSLNAYMNAL